MYKTVWLSNMKYNDISNYRFDVEIDTNYFIKNKYYAPFNLKENIVTAIKVNTDYKSNSVEKQYSSNNRSAIVNSYHKPNSLIQIGEKLRNYNSHTKRPNEDVLIDISASEIIPKEHHNQPDQDTMSFSNDVNFLYSDKNNNFKKKVEDGNNAFDRER